LIYQETLFVGESKKYEKKALEAGNSLHRGPTGEPEGGFVYRGLGERVKECSVNEASLVWDLYEENLEGVIHYWEL
jgi:hypothetical protein